MLSAVTINQQPDPRERARVRRTVLGGVLHVVRVRRGWSVNDAAAAATLAPMTLRRVESGLAVRRRSLAALDGMLDQPAGTVERALADDVAMLALARLVVDERPDDPADVGALLDQLAERFRSGTITSRPSPTLPVVSELVAAAALLDRLVQHPPTPAIDHAIDAIVKAMPDLVDRARAA